MGSEMCIRDRIYIVVNIMYTCVSVCVSVGVICACECEGQWYRTQVMDVYTAEDQAFIKYVDFGGYANVPIDSLKQIR